MSTVQSAASDIVKIKLATSNIVPFSAFKLAYVFFKYTKKHSTLAQGLIFLLLYLIMWTGGWIARIAEVIMFEIEDVSINLAGEKCLWFSIKFDILTEK